MDSELAILESMAKMQSQQVRMVDMLESLGISLLEMGRAQEKMEKRIKQLEDKIKEKE